MSEVYRIWEDAVQEKSLVLTKESKVQYCYVANYLWFFFVEDKQFHIVACFKDTPAIEYQASVKIWFKNEECSYFERTEQFPFDNKTGDDYDIMDPDWISIEVTFRVTKLYGEEYVGPPENESEEDGMVVIVGDQKIFLNMNRIILQSDVLDEVRANSDDVMMTLFEVNPEVFLEMLRVLNPPYKRISTHYFTELLLLACRFRIHTLLLKLDTFSKTPQYDPNWFTKTAWRKIQRILREDPCFSIQILENFRCTCHFGESEKNNFRFGL
ncbi:hypothetical protein CAEBREN_12085 [Caenorhabditis brenneri]|uniref:BTB domain-containing protein n=1 Tax=Caenorhabditis brenneri TaxID=135651 RepID=G0NRH6_CAEBE|nr:hypothetical protein CAEBREN_12085 [Caenorhabditis brenneri]